MSIICITANIYVETDGDPEDVCQTMHGGLESALAGFPDGEVVAAAVEDGRLATDAEISDLGLDEL
jgi:hypothetical protein